MGGVGRRRVLARVYMYTGVRVGGRWVWVTVVVVGARCISVNGWMGGGGGLPDLPSACPTVTVTRSKSFSSFFPFSSSLCDQLIIFSPGPAAVQYDKDSRQKRNNAYEKSRTT